MAKNRKRPGFWRRNIGAKTHHSCSARYGAASSSPATTPIHISAMNASDGAR